MADESYTVGEVAREVQRAVARMESLAARLEGGQFVSSQVFELFKEGQNTKHENLKAEIASLKDDRKWLVRLLLTFIIMSILGVVFAAAGGIPK